MDPEVSVVVPTFNRPGGLIATLTALLGQTGDVRFDVIVVDNASTDWTPTLMQRFCARDPRVVYVREPRQGASHARNAGIARARGAIVAFLDDDVIPAGDWLRTLKAAFDSHPEVDCIGGRVEPQWPLRVPQWMTARHYAPLALQLNRPTDFDADHAAACLVTANFACRRAVFDDIGGFSPSFMRDEDREFNLRLWRAGKRGRFVDGVRVMAPVDPHRLTKAYHRSWYHTTGTNHARLRYREIIDRGGRLVPPMTTRAVFGTPAFVYRECAVEGLRWLTSMVRRRTADAFYYECRVRYLLSYIHARAQLLLEKTA